MKDKQAFENFILSVRQMVSNLESSSEKNSPWGVLCEKLKKHLAEYDERPVATSETTQQKEEK